MILKETFELEELLSEFVRWSEEILCENLTGIYLHGSAVMDCFNPDKSDIDLIVVVDEPMTDSIKRKYMDMVVGLNACGPAKGIEMSVVTKDACKTFVYPTPFDLHFSEMHLEWYKSNPDDYIQKMNGTDSDLAAHFTIIKNRGKCLVGAPIDEVFADVPAEDYLDSIFDDISDAEDDISDNTMYLTLNLARVLAFKKESLILSKKEGGEWALRNLPKDYHELIESALEEYSTDTPGIYNTDQAKAYAKYMLDRISGRND